jgi:hypothetical protein
MTLPPVDPLPDDPLTGELERALAVDHSTAFRARVRERVARESVRRTPGSRWTYAVVGSAALAAGLAALLWSEPDPGPAMTPPPQLERAPSGVATIASESPAADEPPAAPVVRGERPTAPSVAAAMPVGSSPSRVPAPASPAWGPLVVISTGEAAALQRLFREASAGVVEVHVRSLPLEPFASAPELETPPLTVESIGIEPIAVQPLPAIEELGV